MKSLDVKEMKKIELNMLIALDNFCQSHGLKVYLGGGTLLGAVRHKGFIPWDDDIDVMMMRSDYERLLELARDERIGDNLALLSCWDNKDYYYAFAKIVDTRTCMDEKYYERIEGMGAFIDIFPIDYVPRSKYGKKMMFRRRNFWYKINAYPTGVARTKPAKNGMVKLLKIVLSPFGRMIPKNFPSKRADSILRKHSRGKEVVCLSGRYKEKEIMPISYISKSVKVVFEGHEFLAPVGYQDYLVKHYGKNYMELPPAEKRVSNHENNCYWREK